ncbi:hypothetical protein HC231_11190 [Brenneria izadpanahii]|uniref:Uncharacterized protein n=1 Tax=Brenneria izadpanahii TaxID=2722756 RepID=A0ABX7URY0_9GAMM|nr:hypothetical protein [Brenneria izadpanahii]QTF08411.1 hypothetical protein HC231_11190 [Brenneria izadpanahii]
MITTHKFNIRKYKQLWKFFFRPALLAVAIFGITLLLSEVIIKDAFTLAFLALFTLALSLFWRTAKFKDREGVYRIMCLLGDVAAVTLAQATVNAVEIYPNPTFEMITAWLPGILCGLFSFCFYREIDD